MIPPKSNRKIKRDFDKEAYKARHLIENFFCKLKQYRAIATRYDKTARNIRAAIHLAVASTAQLRTGPSSSPPEPPTFSNRGFLHWRFSERRPPKCAASFVNGRHPKTFTEADLPADIIFVPFERIGPGRIIN